MSNLIRKKNDSVWKSFSPNVDKPVTVNENQKEFSTKACR